MCEYSIRLSLGSDKLSTAGGNTCRLWTMDQFLYPGCGRYRVPRYNLMEYLFQFKMALVVWTCGHFKIAAAIDNKTIGIGYKKEDSLWVFFFCSLHTY